MTRRLIQGLSLIATGGTPNHGVWAIPEFSEQNEFSGLSSFIKGLNTPKNAAGDEVTGPVKWLTLRSDKNDKYAQPEGTWIARAGKPTFVTEAGPELKAARNLVLPMADHREASFSPQAFEAMQLRVFRLAPDASGDYLAMVELAAQAFDVEQRLLQQHQLRLDFDIEATRGLEQAEQHLAEGLIGGHVGVRRARLGEGEHPVDHRLDDPP